MEDQILDKKLLGKNMVKKIYWRNGSIVVGLCGGRHNFGFMKVKNRKLCALHSNPKVNKGDMFFDFVMGDRGVILSMGWGDHSNFFPVKKIAGVDRGYTLDIWNFFEGNVWSNGASKFRAHSDTSSSDQESLRFNSHFQSQIV